MKTHASKRIVTITAATLIALSSVPANGGSADSNCVDGLNTTGMSCHQGGDALDSSRAIKPVTNTLNYLKNSNDCNGILNRPDEIAFLRKVDAVNADFMEGKISLEQRGKVLAAAAKIAAAKSSDPRAPNILVGDELELSTRTQETYANFIYLNEQHGIKPTQDQTTVLARMGIKPEDQAAYIQNSSKHLDPGINAMIAAGMRLKPDGTWDLSKMNNKLTPGSIDPTLNSAVGYFMSPDSANDLKNPDRTDAMFRGNVVVLPALTDAQGKHTGKIQTVDAASYKAQLDETLQEFHDAAKEAEAASMASNSATNLFAQHAGKNTTEKQEKAQAFAKLDKSIEELKALGYPATGKNAPMVQVLQIASSLASNDAAAYKAGMANVEKTQHIIKVTAYGALGGAILAGAAKVADFAEAGEDYNAIKAEKGAQAAAQAYKDASILGKAGTYLRLANTAFDKQGLMSMASMAAMPFMFSGGSSIVNGLIDSLTDGTHGGSFGCRFANSMKEQEGSNIMMANFAWATPAISLVGGVTEVASIVKSGGTVSAILNTGQALGFGLLIGKSGLTSGVAAKDAGVATYKAAVSGDRDLAKADAIDFVKKSVEAGTSLWFARQGLSSIGHDTLQSLSTTDGNLGTAAKNHLAVQEDLKNGVYKPGYEVTGKDENGIKKTYTVVDGNNFDTSGTPVVVTRGENGKLRNFYLDDLNAARPDNKAGALLAKVQGRGDVVNAQGGTVRRILNTDVLDGKGTSNIKYLSEAEAKANKVNVADGQAKLNGDDVAIRDTAAEDAATTSHEESVEDAVKKDPKGPIATARKFVADKFEKWIGSKYKASLENNLIIERVLDSLPKDELITLQEKVKNDPNGMEPKVEKIWDGCNHPGVASRGEWDVEGKFRGILYAENDQSCYNL